MIKLKVAQKHLQENIILMFYKENEKTEKLKEVYSNEFTIKEKKKASNANFSIKAKKYSSTLTITNTGDVVLTNIKIIKDKEIVKVIPKLDVNGKVNISILPCDFLPKEENVIRINMRRIVVTCDQGITKKMACYEPPIWDE